MAEDIEVLLIDVLKALCITRDYVGETTLPAIDGWEWYEAGKKISSLIPNTEWAAQFAARTGYCPQCETKGIVIPRGLPAYCEECGYPDEDFADL